MSQGIAGIQLDCLAESRFGGDPVPVEPELYDTQRSLSLGEVGRGLDCTLGGIASARPNLERRRVSVNGAGRERVGNPGPSQGVARIQFGRANIELKRPLCARW